jgi:hypothetical protein
MKVFIIILFLVNCTYAQSVHVDTSFIIDARKNAISLYEERMSEQSSLINGASYHKVQLLHNNRSQLENAHPYYTFEWVQGGVLYDGTWYNTTLLYDVSYDNLIVQCSFPLQRQILLIREKVEQFRLGHRHFVKLSEENAINEGFYEVIHNGHTKVYAGTKKTLERAVGYDVVVPYKYVAKTIYCIKKNNDYYPVMSKASVLKVFSDQKSKLRALLRSQSQSFKDNRTLLIGEMARLYDQLQTDK